MIGYDAPPGQLTDGLTKLRRDIYDLSLETGSGSVSVLVSTIALMRAAGVPVGFTNVSLLGYYAVGDGGGGNFYWDASSAAIDNSGSIINPTGNSGAGRWIRTIDGGYVDVRWFGASTTLTDNSTYFQAAVNFVLTFSYQPELFIPEGQWKQQRQVICSGIRSIQGVYARSQINGSVIYYLNYLDGPGKAGWYCASGCDIEYVSFRGTRSNTDPIGLHFPSELSRGLVRNLYFWDIKNCAWLRQRTFDGKGEYISAHVCGYELNYKDTSLTGITFAVSTLGIVTSSVAHFALADVGRELVIGTFASIVTGYIDDTHVQLANNPASAVAATRGCWDPIRADITGNVITFERSWMAVGVDEGRTLVILRAGTTSQPLQTRIVTVTSGTVATLLDAADAPQTGVEVYTLGVMSCLSNYSDAVTNPGSAPNGVLYEDIVVENARGLPWMVRGTALQMRGNIKANCDEAWFARNMIVWSANISELRTNLVNGGCRPLKIVGDTNLFTLDLRDDTPVLGDRRSILFDCTNAGTAVKILIADLYTTAANALYEISAFAASNSIDGRSFDLVYKPVARSVTTRRYWKTANLENQRTVPVYLPALANNLIASRINRESVFGQGLYADAKKLFYLTSLELLVDSTELLALDASNYWTISFMGQPGFTQVDAVYKIYHNSPDFTEGVLTPKRSLLGTLFMPFTRASLNVGFQTSGAPGPLTNVNLQFGYYWD